MLINCDLGERGVGHYEDDQLVNYIDIANIACGGHAGDRQSVDYYVNLCEQKNIKITAHISYPDRENFGRKVISISNDKLLKSFDEQFALFKNIKAIKPHGALYNELNINEDLAICFIKWCIKNKIQELVLSPFGIVAKHAKKYNIKVLKESFVERGYLLDKNNNPMLIPRGQPGAEITVLNDAVNQYKQLEAGFIEVNGKKIDFKSDTVCIHSDSKISLELAKALDSLKDK